ncbi:MAG: hypothetical protein AB7P69_03180 [Candidatus Binatia bacterium]
MLLSTLWFFGAGVATGFGVWWLSMDRRRGKEVRELVRMHHLQVDAVHEASVRALRYGFVDDFTFLVEQAHRQKDNAPATVLPTAWREEPQGDVSSEKGGQEAPLVESQLVTERS